MPTLQALDARFLTFPRHVQLQTHARCNMACRHCPHPKLDRNKDRGVLPWTAFTQLMDECLDSEEFASIVLDLQNEPLLDTDLVRRIEYIRERQRRPVFVGITTNGLLLDADRFKALVDAGIDRIVVSLNAIDAKTFATLVPRVRFERLLENIQSVLALPGASSHLKLSFGATPANVAQAAAFIKHMEQQALAYRVFAFHDRLQQVDADFLKVPRAPLCHLPLYSVALLLDGSAILCCQDWQPRRILGNAFASSLRAVWNTSEYHQIRSSLLAQRRLPDSPCAGCAAPVQLGNHIPFNEQQMHRLGLRFFSSQRAAINGTQLQIAPRRNGFVLVNGRSGQSEALDHDLAEAVDALLHGETVSDPDLLASARQLISRINAQPPVSPLTGVTAQLALADGVRANASIQSRNGPYLHLKLADSITHAGLTAVASVCLLEDTVRLDLRGQIVVLNGSTLDLHLDPSSVERLDQALMAQASW